MLVWVVYSAGAPDGPGPRGEQPNNSFVHAQVRSCDVERSRGQLGDISPGSSDGRSSDAGRRRRHCSLLMHEDGSSTAHECHASGLVASSQIVGLCRQPQRHP